MALCILAGGKVVALATAAFTLAWTHSVEKTRWEEDWILTPDGLRIVEARVKGAGAGMEPPADAVASDGWWVYRPKLPPTQEVMLAASGATGGGWELCADTNCMVIGAIAGDTTVLRACRPDGR